MPKVHPNAVASPTCSKQSCDDRKPVLKEVKPVSGDVQVLTVWKKSLLFNCDGFTVYDCKGNLCFRVDNYVSSNKAETLLMDASGEPLLTIRRKPKLSLVDNWMIYEGESNVNPKFMAKKKKQVNFSSSKSLAQVIGPSKDVMYEIEGSYTQRLCAVFDSEKRVVAEIKRKEAVAGGTITFGVDVFRLIVQPGIDTTDTMALVILLDQMFGSRW